MSVATAFAGFPAQFDVVKSDGTGQANWNGTLWTGALKTLHTYKLFFITQVFH